MWWLVWGVLVVGTLVGAFFLGRDLWRKAVALGGALGEASRALGDASARIGDAVEDAAAHPVDTSPTLFDDMTSLHDRVVAQREARALRAAERRERQLATVRGWSVEAWLEARRSGRSTGVHGPDARRP
ncbi:hypothetical protein ET495_04625 [Xylanimonas allomyrinae]|uniref:Uncharacterized protein n=1 Tax=Xylanimonas allomyrinae TaxID=2509459 RepID=A0A4P6EJD6_9MICO|nr:hypothetical protein [Xylanimonas allomyrinae]QAY62662.1 hypothetical protein ET495_04625 [Xylanimonas allomyrinae]